MITNKQGINSGNYSTNVQAKGDVIIQGTDEGLIRGIVEHQLKGQLSILTNEAYEIYKSRCKDFSDGLITAFSQNYNLNVDRLREPSVQFSINSAHKAYGETGSEDLKETLITIVGKMCSTGSTHLDRLYKDAIEITSKLTSKQINFLSLIGSLFYVESNSLIKHDLLFKFIEKNVAPVMDNLPEKNIEIEHLDYLGLGSIEGFQSRTPAKIFLERYSALFQKGFELSEIYQLPEDLRPSLEHFIPCLNDDQKVQTRYLNARIFEKSVPQNSIKDDIRGFISIRMTSNQMSEEEVNNLISKNVPIFRKVLDYVTSFNGDKFFLTTVGQMIAVIRIEAITGEPVDISQWA